MPDWRRLTGRFQTDSSFPKMVGNLFWEHGHRMVATTVGMLTIVLMIYILVKEKRAVGAEARRLCAARSDRAGIARRVDCKTDAAAGGFNCSRDARPTVLLHDRQPGGFHFAKLDGSDGRCRKRRELCRCVILCTAALVTIFLQLILGATLRHSATWDQHLPTELILAHIGGAVAVTLDARKCQL